MEAVLSEVQSRLAAIEQTLQEFQQLAWALLVLASRSPVYLDVDHMDVERLDFHVGQVDVGELSGEMNIGLTSILKPSPAGPQGGGARPPTHPPQPQDGQGRTPPRAHPGPPMEEAPESLPTAPIWPPSGGDAVDSEREPPDAGPDEPGAAGPPPGGPGAGR